MKSLALALCLMTLTAPLASAQEGELLGECSLDVEQPMRVGFFNDSPLIDVIAGPEAEDGTVCVSIPEDEAFGGLIHANEITIREAKREIDWIGDWNQPGASISIADGGPGGWFLIDAFAQYDAVNAANGAVNVGEFYAEAPYDPLDASYMAFAVSGEETLPFAEASPGDCTLRMRRVGKWLWVRDNNQCGGLNVSFSGVYTRPR